MNALQSWIAPVVAIAESGMRLAAQATPPAALLAAAVLAVNVLCRRWLTAGQLGLLWALVLLRLVLPAAPQSVWSLQRFNPLASPSQPAQDWGATVETPNASAALQLVNGFTFPLSNQGSVSSASTRPIHGASVLPAVWLCGALAVFATTAIGHWHLRSELKLAARCDDRRLLQLWAIACRTAGRRRVPEIALFNGVQQPALVGLFRPQLLLPAETGELSDEQLRMIMLHEAAHLRRYDLAANWLLAIIRTVHWWNPVFWLAAIRYASLREQACDAFVASRLTESERRGYGELLISMAAREPRASRWRIHMQASLLGFLTSPAHRSIRSRLAALKQWRGRRTRGQLIAAMLLIILLAGSGLTDVPAFEARASQEPQTITEWLAQSRVSEASTTVPATAIRAIAPLNPHNGPLVARTYDLTRVMQQLAVDEPDVAPSVSIESLLSLMFDPLRPADQKPSRSFKPLQKPKPRFRIEGTTLHAFATESFHGELAACLAAWGDAGLTQICVETRMIRSHRDLAAAVALSWEHFEAFASQRSAAPALPDASGETLADVATATDEHLPIVVAKLDQVQAAAIVSAAQSSRRNTTLQLPKVTVFNGQTATLADCVQRPFVIGVSYVEGAPGHSGARQPKIEVVESGTQVRFRATHSKDRKLIELQAHIHTADVEHVYETTALHRGEAITIQNPRVKRRDVTVAEVLAEGESLLVGYLSAADQGEFFYVLLTPQALTGRTFGANGEAAAAEGAPAGR